MPTGTETVKVYLTEEEFDEVARALAEHHRNLKDEDTRLIVRHELSDRRNIHLLEVMGKFPAEASDKLSRYEFSPTKDLLIPGKYFFTLISTPQFDHAIHRRNPFIVAVAREASELSREADKKMLLYSTSKADQRLWNKIKSLA